MKRQSGFSLVEALVSLLILGVGIIGILEGLTLSYHTSRDSEGRTAAALLASARLELLRAEGILVAGEDEGDFGEGYEGWTWRESILETPTEGLHEVTVSVHRAPGKEKVHELRTLLYDMPYLGVTADSKDASGRSPDRQRRERP